MKVLSTQGPPQVVYVPAIPTFKTVAKDGTTVQQTRLTELLPALIQSHSPIKDRGGYFKRRVIRGEDDDDAEMAVGTVEQHMKGLPIKALVFEPADLFNLRETNEGYYTGDIIFEPASIITSGPQVQDSNAPGPSAIVPTHLTGAGSDKLLEIAREREKHSVRKNPELMKAFLQYLRDTAKVDLSTYPAGPVNALNQYTAFMNVLTTFKPWLKKRMGYVVPADSEKFHGQDFTKADIILALGLKSSTMNNITQYFGHERLLHTADAFEWFNTGGEKHASIYNSMKPAMWKKRLDTNMEAAQRRKRRRSASGSGGDSDSSDSEDSADDRERSKKEKKKSKKRSTHRGKASGRKSSKPDSYNVDE